MPAEGITDDIRQMEGRMNMRRQTIWFFFLFVTGFSLAIELIFELFRQILSRQEIEAEKNKAELALYKAQINPHFLFNTLSPRTLQIGTYGISLHKIFQYSEIHVSSSYSRYDRFAK